MASWDPAQYLSFADQRLRPALELLGRVPLESPARVVDLGCGAGNVTVHLGRRWPQAELTGVDSSAEMLAAARKADAADAADAAGAAVRWVQGDLGSWTPAAPPDVIYANAALHWLPDHGTLFPRLMGLLAPDGALAVQMPRNFGEPSHTCASEVARAGPWAQRLAHLVRPAPVADPERYYDILAPLCSRVDLWETHYLQVLHGGNPVAEFTKGSWLRQFLADLTEPERSAFESEYRRLIAQAYPRRDDGSTVFPFRRLFMVATRS